MPCPSTLRWAQRSAYEDGLLQADLEAGAPLHTFVLTFCRSLAARAQGIVSKFHMPMQELFNQYELNHNVEID